MLLAARRSNDLAFSCGLWRPVRWEEIRQLQRPPRSYRVLCPEFKDDQA